MIQCMINWLLTRAPWIPLALLTLFILSPGVSSAQTASGEPRLLLDSLLRANAHTMKWSHDTAQGPGWDLLLEAAAEAQFVVIGEQHLTRELPAFTTALFHELQARYEFQHVALEEGPVLTAALGSPPLRGDLDAIKRYIRQFPNSVHMLSDDEVRMFAEIGAASTAKFPLWGVNEPVGASHILTELIRRAPNEAAKRLAETTLAQALEYEAERYQKGIKFFNDGPSPRRTNQLAEAFAGDLQSEFLVEMLALAHRISAPYGANAQNRPGDYFWSSETREESMKALFVRWYRQAVAGGDTLPKVLLKSGNVHARRGVTPYSELLTLGSFVSEVARFNGKSALFLTAHVFNDESVYQIPEDSWFRPIADAASSADWTVFDLRPIQPWIRSARLRGLPSELRELLRGFDTLLVMRGATRSSIDEYITPNFRWFPGG